LLLTAAQQQAVSAEGNVLVSASAGTGKTRVLVERCLARLLASERASVEGMLVATFTEAAAAELKDRLRARLEEQREAWPYDSAQRRHWDAQLALLDLGYLGTLHSFCLRLVRDHAHELRLDPQFAVLGEAQAWLLREEALTHVIEAAAGDASSAEAYAELLASQAGGREETLRQLIWRIHCHAHTLPDAAAWLEREHEAFARSQPESWRARIPQALEEWRQTWLPRLLREPAENGRAHRFARQWAALPSLPDSAQAAEFLREVMATDRDWPRGTKGKFREPIAGFYDAAAFLGEQLLPPSGPAPLDEDWEWCRHALQLLLRLVAEFGRQFAGAKRQAGAVDFADLEQFSLQLLWDGRGQRPTALAQRWRQRLEWVCVDEYQDINNVQDTLLRALGRETPAGNRFLVGDAKQSIYRFRLANPRLFSGYQSSWQDGRAEHQVIHLAENFRSHEGLLQFANDLFAPLLGSGLGGLLYDDRAALRFGAPDQRSALTKQADPQPRATIYLLSDRTSTSGETEEASARSGSLGSQAAAPTLTPIEREAGFVADRIRDWIEGGLPVWDESIQAFRSARWGDVAVLLRSLAWRAEIFAQEFARRHLPLHVGVGDFFEREEIRDLLNLLQVLDNPLQDIPLLAVLRSPLVGLSAKDLAVLRIHTRSAPFWTAVRRGHWHWRPGSSAAPGADHSAVSAAGGSTESAESTELNPVDEADGCPRLAPAAWEKLDQFLERFERWRRLARDLPLSQRLEAAIDETGYADWLEAQPGSELRVERVRHLLRLARQFDPLQRQGLARFLRYLEASQRSEATFNLPGGDAMDAVQLTTIHRSKGLEYPIVVLPDLGKAFNLSDLHDRLILDEELGLCPVVRPPDRLGAYPSLPYWLAAERQRAAMLAEEVRLLYVGVTRARDALMLVGTAEPANRNRWVRLATSGFPAAELLTARCCLDWLGAWLLHHTHQPDGLSGTAGQTDLCRWEIHAAGMPVHASPDPACQGTVTSHEPGRGGILAAQTTGGTDGDRDVAVPIEAGFLAPQPERQFKGSSHEPDTGIEGGASVPASRTHHLLPSLEPALLEPETGLEGRASVPASRPGELSSASDAAREYARPTDRDLNSGQANEGLVISQEPGAGLESGVQGDEVPAAFADDSAPPGLAEEDARHLAELLTWRYEFGPATQLPGKMSVTALRRRAAAEEEELARAFPFLTQGSDFARSSEPKSPGPSQTPERLPAETPGGLSPAETGTAYHRFLECADLARVGSPMEIRQQARSLVEEGRLTEAEAAVLDVDVIAGFWNSTVGRQIRDQGNQVERELPFTMRLDHAQAMRLHLPPSLQPPPEEFLLVQGIVDLAVVGPDEIWILDYKTDRVSPEDLPSHAALYVPQLRLYAQALTAIYRRPVSRLWLHFLVLNRTVEVALADV
jgi:ATP-dependent helicase/nuclease subunit A